VMEGLLVVLGVGVGVARGGQERPRYRRGMGFASPWLWVLEGFQSVYETRLFILIHWFGTNASRSVLHFGVACTTVVEHMVVVELMLGQKDRNIQQAGFPDGHPL
jgi:hypothetical protein